MADRNTTKIDFDKLQGLKQLLTTYGATKDEMCHQLGASERSVTRYLDIIASQVRGEVCKVMHGPNKGTFFISEVGY